MNDERLRHFYHELAHDAQVAQLGHVAGPGAWLIPVDNDEQNAEDENGRVMDDPSNPQQGVDMFYEGVRLLSVRSLTEPDANPEVLRAFVLDALNEIDSDQLQDGFAIYKSLNAPSRPRFK